MMRRNGRLVVLVSAIAVAAVALGGVLAYRQAPRAENAEAAAPLSASPPSTSTTPATPKPSIAPSVTPAIKPSTPPPAPRSVAATTGPTTITLNVTKLPQGAAPRVPYLVGREVRGGGATVRIPGNQSVLAFARVKNSVLAHVSQLPGSELLTIDGKSVKRTAGVNSLVASSDHTAAAYAIPRAGKSGQELEGGTVYADNGTGVQKLEVTKDWHLEVIAYSGGKVFYRTGDKVSGPGTWRLYEWTPGATKAALVKAVPELSAVTADGKIAAALMVSTRESSCSAVTVIATGSRLWKTCDYYLAHFTPDGAFVVGGPVDSELPCNKEYVALDAKTGGLIREWKACVTEAVPEDDQHLLLSVMAPGATLDKGTDSAIIRCTIRTGACERATPFSAEYSNLDG
jgi:hypothetical protein